MPAGATFVPGEQKVRPGVFVQIQNIGAPQPVGQRLGSVACIFRNNWGALNSPNYVYNIEAIPTVYGIGGTSGNGIGQSSIDLIQEVFRAGTQQVVALRLGSAGGGVNATAVLNDSGAAAVMTLTAAQPGTRPNPGSPGGGFTISIRDSLTLTSPQQRDFVLYEGQNVLAQFVFPKGSTVSNISGVARLVGSDPYPTITTSAANHGLVAGQYVTIAAVAGATNANGTWQIATVPAANQFTIPQPLALTGAYTSGGTVALNETIPLVALINAVASQYITATGTTAATGGAITAVTNVPNAAITMTSPPAVVPGQQVTVAGVQGATGVNGTWTVLGVTGSVITINNPGLPGVWTSGGTVTAPIVGTGQLAALSSFSMGNSAATPAGVAGVDPTPTGTDLINALNALEPEDWNVLVTDLEDSVSHASIQAYVNRVRYQGKRVIAVVGQPTSVLQATRFTNASSYNDFGMVYVANGFVSALGNREGYRAAGRVAGMIASSRVASSLTHAPVVQATGLVGGLSNADLDRAINAGCLVFSRNASRQIQIEYGINTYITPDANHDAGWHKIRRVRTRDALVDRISQSLDPVVGNVTNSPDGQGTLMMLAQNVINAMIREGALLAGTVSLDPNNPPAGDAVWFRADVDDLDSAEHVYVTFGFRFSPPATPVGTTGRAGGL